MKRMPSFFFAVLLCALFFSSAILAQVTTGAVSGTVRDESGAILPGVSVEVKHLATGINRSVLSDDQGRYIAANLALGDYALQASLAGFQTAVRSGVGLTRSAEFDALYGRHGELIEQLRTDYDDQHHGATDSVRAEARVLGFAGRPAARTVTTWRRSGFSKVCARISRESRGVS